MAGIFTIECCPENNHYLGVSDDPQAALDAVLRSLREGRHSCKSLQAEWNKYSEDDFEMGIPELFDEGAGEAEVQSIIDSWMNILEEVEYLGWVDKERGETADGKK